MKIIVLPTEGNSKHTVTPQGCAYKGACYLLKVRH